MIHRCFVGAGDVYQCSYSDCSYSTPKRSQLACHTRAVHLQVSTYIRTYIHTNLYSAKNRENESEALSDG